MLRLLQDDGAIFYNHKWRVQNGLLQDRADIVSDFPVRQIIIWQRAGGVNFNDAFFCPMYEVIYVIAKPKFRLLPRANGVGDIWRINQDNKNKHPAPFPVDLPDRIIRSTNAEIILDPFIGSGTTAVAAKRLNRHYIGIELSTVYCEMARQRIKKDDFIFSVQSELELEEPP
jgi:modification methylase